MISIDDTQGLTERTVRFRKWTFSFREVVLTVLLLVVVFLFLVFAGLFGSKSSELNTISSKLSAGVTQPQCKTPKCLETSAYSVSSMNQSINPCDNFFQFACGGYKKFRPMGTGHYISMNVRGEMMVKNEAILESLLSGPLPPKLSRSSSQHKVKNFYTACTDDFTREQSRGTPLINKMRPNLLNYLIDPNFNPSTWNFDTTLGQVRADLWLEAFYAIKVKIDRTNPTQRIIAIYPGRMGYSLYWRDYTDTPTSGQRKLQNVYKKFMRVVAQLIARDAGLPNDQSLADRIDVFVTDAFDVESKMAKFAFSSRYQRGAFSEARKVTLSDLKQRTGNLTDWTAQMSYLFNEVTITDNTKVVIPYPTYLTAVTTMIQRFDPNARNRKLHNYLTWRALETYVRELSGEYVHASRQFYVNKFGYTGFLGTQTQCFRMAKRYFNIALGALYVNARFDMKNKDKANEITESLKTSLENIIAANTWMDKATKDYAIEKMKGSTYKIGYPDFMADEAKVDAIYQQLSINQSDYFGSLLACNMQHRRWWNKQLREGEDRSQWVFNTYDTSLAVILSRDEIVVPAGLLQFPMYEHAMPHYYSFGAIGSFLGRFIHHFVDEIGRHWDKGGVRMKTETGWWSNQTAQNYNVARQCVADLYNNITQGPYTSYNGEQKTVAVNGDWYAREAMAVTTGIRLAYNAYQSWQQKYGQDSISPGLQFSPMQLFFIAHAQSNCYRRDPVSDYYYVQWKTSSEDTRVNVALQQLPEFQQAFQCQASDNMVPAKRCTYL